MHRRDFLTPATHRPAPVGECLLLRGSRRAMATLFEAVVPYGTPNAQPAVEAALEHIDSLEHQLTVYADTSEVSRLNRVAPRRAVPVEPGLFGLLELSARLTQLTGGAFDITAGPLIKCWGFYRRQGAVPDEAARLAALACVGMGKVTLDPATRSVRTAPGVEINLGSIGKGYALDRVADTLRSDWGIASALLNGGSSSLLAIGAPPHDPRGWIADLHHPADYSVSLGHVTLRDQALCTSANALQKFVADGKTYGHLLDPRTGVPARGVALASVIAPTAAEADALATACFVAGPALAKSLCDARPDLGTVLLTEPPDDTLYIYGLARRQFLPAADISP